MSSRKEWNPRYVEYARVFGRTPREQLNSETNMAGFICFNRSSIARFRVMHPEHVVGSGVTEEGMHIYDEWLARWIDLGWAKEFTHSAGACCRLPSYR